MAALDLGPAVDRLIEVVRGVPDDRLGDPTPCPDYRVGDLLHHIEGAAMAFTAAAAKDRGGDGAGPGPSGDGPQLAPGWRQRIPDALVRLGQAWRDPEAWTGMTAAGGVDLPAEVAGLFALDEVVIHGWDLARATDQPFEVDPALLVAVRDLVAQVVDSGQADGGLFGPPVPVSPDAPLLEVVVGMTGRDPDWTPASADRS